MAYSKCGQCGSSSFKLVTQEPSGSAYKFNFIQCSSCDAPIGVVDFFNTGDQINKLEKRVKNLESLLGIINGNISTIAKHVIKKKWF